MGSAASAPQDGGGSGSGLSPSTSLPAAATSTKEDGALPINNPSSSSSLSGPKNDDQDRSKQRYKKKKDVSSTLSGPAWVEEKCKGKKKAWQQCVGGWYDQRFINGAALENETASDYNCDELFEKYKACYVKGMANQLERRNKNNNGAADGRNDAIKPGSLLDEYLQETTTRTESTTPRQQDEKRQ